jgi:EmrB/QacA subfamily drug resistance transporter
MGSAPAAQESLMEKRSPKTGFSAAFRGVLSGREPPPSAFIERRPSYPWFVVGTVSIGAVMGQLDASIAQLLLPALEEEFGARLDVVSWVAIAYLLVQASLLPIFGRLADFLGRKLLYIGGFLLFVLGSALCGSAPNLPLLISARVLQAVGSALLAANSLAIVVTAAGPERRGRAIGVQGAAQAIGLSAGPALGGLLLHAFGWRWVFWINVPVGLAGAVVGWFVLPRTKLPAGEWRFDWPGALLIAPALTFLLVAIDEAQAWGPTSPALIGAALLASLFIAAFVSAERRAASPLVEPSLFRSRALTAGIVAGALAQAMLFGMLFLMAFVFVRGYQESALAGGLRLAIIPVALGLVAPLSGALYDRLGPRILTVSGMATCLGGYALLLIALGPAHGDMGLVMLGLAVFGIGQGLFTAPNNSSIMGAAPESLTGEVGGLLNLTRSCGMSFGIAAGAALLSWRLQVLTGVGHSTLAVAPADLLTAARGVILLFTGAAAIALFLSFNSAGAPREALPPGK